MRTAISSKNISNTNGEFELRRGPWTSEEDTLLIHYIACHGEGSWNLLAKCAGLNRTGKSCRLRWLNYLKPDIKRGNLTPKEQILILELHSKWGNRWSKIAQHLPGRTDNEIKNYWRTRVQKQARQLKIDANSNKFLEAIRCFWMPRLLEKMEQTSPLSSPSSSSISTTETRNSENPAQITDHDPNNIVDTVNPFNEKSCPKIYSSDSCPTPKTQTLNHPEIPAQTFGNAAYYTNSFLYDDCYHLDISSFDMDGFNQAAMSTEGSDYFPFSESQRSDWINGEIETTFWNMDELWQFRKPDEVGI